MAASYNMKFIFWVTDEIVEGVLVMTVKKILMVHKGQKFTISINKFTIYDNGVADEFQRVVTVNNFF